MNDTEISFDSVEGAEISISPVDGVDISISAVDGTETSIAPMEGVVISLVLVEDADKFSSRDCERDCLADGCKLDKIRMSLVCVKGGEMSVPAVDGVQVSLPPVEKGAETSMTSVTVVAASLDLEEATDRFSTSG